MIIEYDLAKNEKNILERGIPFELAKNFDLSTALIRIDLRENYRETRFNASGLIGSRLFHLTFTLRADRIRVISLRKANKREVKYYVSKN